RLNEPSAVVLMHELVGHNHPIATAQNEKDNNAHYINYFFMKKLGISYPSFDPHTNPHKGYFPKLDPTKTIKWDKIDLYQTPWPKR
ncbi:MAG: hypothetical protein ACOCWG_04145, partial [bacterium]